MRNMIDADRAREIYGRFQERSSRDDEYNEWTGYRAELTEFIVSSIPAGGTLLILGAGKCNDLNLKKLSDHCGSTTLSDYRPETAEEAFSRYDLSPDEKIRFLESDYVGIPDEAYLEYTEQLIGIMRKLAGDAGTPPEEKVNPADKELHINPADHEQAAGPTQPEPHESQGTLEQIAGPELSRLQESLERIYRDNADYRIDLGEEIYDNAVIAGVHSQLNNSFRGIFQYVRKDIEDTYGPVRFAEELNAAVFRITREHTEELVRRFNQAVFERVREGVIYGYENSIIYTPEGAKSPVIGTVDGARQAGEAISEMEEQDRLTCLWPLSARRGIKFEMVVAYLKV